MSSEENPPVTPWGETVRVPERGPLPAGPPLPPEVSGLALTQRVGRYIRSVKLGQGGMGEVWKAWDVPLGRWVAIKLPKGGDDTELGRFQREAQMAGRLQHPNIAAIYEVGVEQGRPFIAMQFIEGVTLGRVKREDRNALVGLARDAARAVHFAHEQGVIHRDIKPENVMVDAKGRAFVMDFGLARATEGTSSMSATGMTVGTPMYMAPEQARGERVDARADVFSLGLTLYELLSGVRPFESPSVYETLRRVQELDPPPLKGVEPDLETVVFKAMAKEPADRYASAGAFADDLDHALKGEAIQARRDSISRKAWRRVKKHPVASAALTLLLIALSVSAGFALGARHDRAVIEITARLEEGLQGPWTAARLDAFDRDRAALEKAAGETTYRARLVAALAAAARAEGEAGKAADAQRTAGLLERLDAPEAEKVRRDLASRASLWRLVFRSEDERSWPPGAVRKDGDVLRAVAAGKVMTLSTGTGPAELRAEFEGGWRKSTRVGLLMDGGYAFLVTSESAAKPPYPTLELAARAVILRNETVIREEPLDLTELGTSLKLLAARDGDRLSFRVNERVLEVVDPFPLAADAKGAFGFVWPADAGLRRGSGSRQDRPSTPGPLQDGDELFTQGKTDEALERYREAAAKAGPGPLRQEARYKEALCHLKSGQEDAARAVLEEVAGGLLALKPGEDTRWMFLSDCQLLLIHFRRRDGLPEATQILEKLPIYKYPLQRFAALLPADVRGLILHRVEAGNVGPNLRRKPEEHIARAEFSVRASELLEPVSRHGEYRYHGLMRAYMMAGRESDAHRMAETIYPKFGFAGEASADQSWMLRISGQLDKALAVCELAVKANPDRKVERARVRAARGEHALAMKDVEEVIASCKYYGDWSAACLMKGFLLERSGAPAEQAQAAWKVGLLRNWKGEEAINLYSETSAPSGMSVLHAWLLGSLTDTIDDAEAGKLLQALLRFSGRDVPGFVRLLKPSVIRVAWKNPRAYSMARRLAFRDLPFTEAVLSPVHVGWVEFVHQVCLPEGPIPREVEDLLWNLGKEVQESQQTGVLDERYLLPLAAILNGNPNAPGMGWKEVAGLLKDRPTLRGPFAWIFAERYVRKGDLPNARKFVQAALEDAEREPSLAALKPLAQATLARLEAKQ
jgi:tetratricopeptide (TPR) repeat protein/predicted Ser/Thr protein kinase